jgi:HEAT repeat protein
MLAVRKLAESGERHHVGSFARMLGDEDDRVRVAVLKAIGLLGSHDLVPDVIPLLKDPNGFIVTTAVEALGKLNGDEARRALVAILSRSDKEIKRAALNALSAFDDAEDLIVPFLNDPDWATRVVAAQGLQSSDKEFVRKELVNALQGEDDAVVRKALMGEMSA